MISQRTYWESFIHTIGFEGNQADELQEWPRSTQEEGDQKFDFDKLFLRDLNHELSQLILPTNLPRYYLELLKLNHVPRMCSLAIAILLFEAIRTMPEDLVYLNIGVWHGFSFLVGQLAKPNGRCIGVDNFSEWGSPKESFYERFRLLQGPHHAFYEQDYADYLRSIQNTHREKIGVYFLDGPHWELDQWNGLEMAHPLLAPGAYIFIDDSNLYEVQAPTIEFVKKYPEYVPIANHHTANNAHTTWWNGLIILKKQ